jgi:hypothetical protein
MDTTTKKQAWRRSILKILSDREDRDPFFSLFIFRDVYHQQVLAGNFEFEKEVCFNESDARTVF